MTQTNTTEPAPRRGDVIGSLIIAAVAASLAAGAKWSFPELFLPGWLPSGVFLGLLFSNPMQTIRRGKPCMRCALRFAFGVGLAAFVHVTASLMLQNDSGLIFLPFVIPLLLVPLFLRSGVNAMTSGKPRSCRSSAK